MKKKTYKRYDHRLKLLVINSENLEVFKQMGIPKSTLSTWRISGVSEFITLEEFDLGKCELISEILELKSELELKDAELNVLKQSRKIFGILPNWKRFKNAEIKEKILNLYKSFESKINADSFCKLVDISTSRLKAWQNKFIKCDLSDQSSCPKTMPGKILTDDLKIMERFVTSIKYMHIPITNLAYKAMREGLLFFSPSTWHKYTKEFNWRRPKFRVHEKKQEIGYRATSVNESWHIDISIMKLLDGSKVYIQAIIDNFSRYIVAHQVFTEVSGENTKELLSKAIKNKKVNELISDGGVENINKNVQEFSIKNKITQIIAQIDIQQSNSMIEAFFRSLKNNYLYFKPINTLDKAQELVNFYVNEHNNSIPHAGIKYCIPAQIYNGANINEQHQKLKAIHHKKLKIELREIEILKHVSLARQWHKN